MKYKKGLVQDIQDKKQFQKEQELLKKKHHMEQEERVIVEKNNMLKFLIRMCGSVIRCTAAIVILAMAVIGIMALVYPAPRNELVHVWQDIYGQLQQYLVFLP